jgi:aerobic-type carbon monoxide dehydrogenase small subunit (CoxS/CutS family)
MPDNNPSRTDAAHQAGVVSGPGVYDPVNEARVTINATVNGRQVRRTVPIHYRVIDFVREELKLTGNKEGCGSGECGTCSMFIDGALVKSCLVPVQKIAGRTLETVDDLDRDAGLTVVQQAFHKCGSSQCGYCIPGMVMAATATLRKRPHASIGEIREGLGGNVCRCTGYQKIVDAVELARDVLNGTKPAEALDEEQTENFIGSRTRRLDAPAKVSGAIKYAADMWMPNMLHMQVLRSPHPYARIERIDATQARALPGVEAILTCDDVPGVDNFGVFIEDQPVMARGVVRYTGEAVVAVVADSPEVAHAAVALIRVTYSLLDGVFDPEAAMRDGMPQLHDFAPGNICKHTKIRKGDVVAGFAAADVIVEETYQTAAVEHAYLEPEAGLAYVEPDGCVTVHSPSQNITHHRHMLAKILGRPINKVRMIMSTVGGGFGGKEDMLYQGMLALAAIKTRRPVRYVFTREESFIASAKRHPFLIRYRMGLKRNGRIVATEMKMIADGGAYAMSSPGVMNKSAILGPGPYAIPNVWVDAIAVYTNNTPSGAFRAFGAFQSEFSTESHLDLCAERLGMDPIALRRVNLMQDGAVTHTGQQLDRVLATACLDGAVAAAGWDDGVAYRSGRGEAPRCDLGRAGTREPCVPGVRFSQLVAELPAIHQTARELFAAAQEGDLK